MDMMLKNMMKNPMTPMTLILIAIVVVDEDDDDSDGGSGDDGCTCFKLS